MAALDIDGKATAARLRQQLAVDVGAWTAATGRQPGLAVVLVGDNPASQVYVRNKARQCREVGMASSEHHLPAETPEDDLLALVARLNGNPGVNGILVQLPLPAHIDAQRVISAIDPGKDVDGFHPINAGRLATGLPGFVPCTPLGCLHLLKETVGSLAGQHAVVVGRSNIVGKPMAALLLQQDCTVTVAHSRTRNLPDVCRQADILVAAVGKPHFIQGDWIKPGATVIDVGINRVGDKLAGDVDYQAARIHAHAITPVPGGVGPMTIACLLLNTFQAAQGA